jgi:hypothetical protein
MAQRRVAKLDRMRRASYPAGMKRTLLPFLILAIIALNHVRAETEPIDPKALAQNARPAVLLWVVSDADGEYYRASLCDRRDTRD